MLSAHIDSVCMKCPDKIGQPVWYVAFSCLGYIKRGEILHTKTSFIMLIVMLYAADQADAVSAAELSNQITYYGLFGKKAK